ncbi:MAG: DNA-3-methyladenine glycosylase [Acidobacteria bacterium]|nr:DNA-3-methyladenine glycosylase [Acidobacteriota bacterium]MBV9146994.1 DNA-3-methyladenine glycosylase [Acidobacteriota bacterium]MBV9436002.1 DNA-3-methyladenine glycosylase [Acidobacteriota bacterium]
MPGKREHILPQSFYARDPRIVARDLLGKILVRTSSQGATKRRLAGRIVELEVYLGEGDLAAHSAAGRTERNQVLFGPPGHAYVYFIYGMYYCLNFSCMPEGNAGCVLLRALEPLEGIETMAKARGISEDRLGSTSGLRLLTSGPGRLCQALGITRTGFNAEALYKRDSRLQIVEDGFTPGEVRTTMRVGITKSAEMPLRYIIAQNPFVSRG